MVHPQNFYLMQRLCYHLVTLFHIRCSFCRIRFVDSKYFHATAPSGEMGNGHSCNRVAYAHRYRATKSNCVFFSAFCVYFSIFVYIAFKLEKCVTNTNSTFSLIVADDKIYATLCDYQISQGRSAARRSLVSIRCVEQYKELF